MTIPASSITVNDGAGTPVPHVFSINDREGLKSSYRNSAATLVRGSETMIHQVSLGTTKDASNRAVVSLSLPKEGDDATTGQKVVLRTTRMKAEFFFSPDSSEAERIIDYVLFANLLDDPDVMAAATKLISLG